MPYGADTVHVWSRAVDDARHGQERRERERQKKMTFTSSMPDQYRQREFSDGVALRFVLHYPNTCRGVPNAM